MKKTPLSLLVLFVLVACDGGPQVAALQKKVADSDAEVKALKVQVDQLKTDFNKRVNQLELDNTIRQWDQVAYLTPGSDGYAPIRFDLGFVTVRLADVVPYANGSKVTLLFGNPLSAKVNGLKATIEWGKVDGKGVPLNDEAKSKEVTAIEELRAGAWTRIPVVLEGVPPNELGFVRVRDVHHQGISLMK